MRNIYMQNSGSKADCPRSRRDRTPDLLPLQKQRRLIHIIKTVFLAYLIRLEALEQSTDSHCEQIRKLIELQFDIVEAMEQGLLSIST